MFSGSDPSDDADWQSTGVFKVPFAVGEKPTARLSDDCAIFSGGGVFTLGTLSGKATVTNSDALTYKIRSELEQVRGLDAEGISGLFFFENEQLLIVNLPISK